MPSPLEPGVFERMFAEMEARAETVMEGGLAAVAEAIEESVRDSFVGQHPYGTPTPASPGGPPSRISKTLEGSLGHTEPTHDLTGLHVRVGVEDGHFPDYNHRIDSATYGHYLEVEGAGKSHRRYPFLVPAFNRIAGSTTRIAQLFRAIPWI